MEKNKIIIVLLLINVFSGIFLIPSADALQNNFSSNYSNVSSRPLPISDDISRFIPSEQKIKNSLSEIYPIPPVKPDISTYKSPSVTTLTNRLTIITSLNYTNIAKPRGLVNISFTVDGYIDNTDYYIGIYDWASGTWIKDDYQYHNGTFSKKYDWNFTTPPIGQKYWLSVWYWESSNSSFVLVDSRDIIISILMLPDLAVKDIIFSNNIALINIKNSGYISANNINYNVYDGNPNPNYMNNNSYRKTRLIYSDNIPILNYSEFDLFSILFPIDQDFHKAYVVVDPINTIEEINESNNNASKAMRLNSNVHELDVLAVIYTNYVYNNLSTSQIEFTKSQINNYFKQFYWDHTLTLRLNISYLQIDDLYYNSHLWEITPGKFWMSPWDVESDLRNRGVTDNAYDTIYVFYAWKNTYGSEAAFGGGAYGPDINWMGNTTYASEPIFHWDTNTTNRNPNVLGEIAIHEVLHNIGGMYEAKGDSDFKNSDNMGSETTFINPMEYYEWMLETWPTQKWFELKWGTNPINCNTNYCPVHNINKHINYTTIQAAINDASPGNEIHVDSGTYYENVNVTKQLTLRGIGMPIVESSGSWSAITLSADGIMLEGFTVTGGGSDPDAGIKVMSNNNMLIGNNASNNSKGIYLSSSNHTTLSGNNASNNGYGIYLYYSSNNILKGNNASNNALDLWLDYSSNMPSGISLIYSSNNTLISNNANSNSGYYNEWGQRCGISLLSSNNNTLSGNNANSNNNYGIDDEGNYGYSEGYGYGIYLSSSNSNTLSDNTANLNSGKGEGTGNTEGFGHGYGYGIYLSLSNNNTLSNNYANSNYGYGYAFGGGIGYGSGYGYGISLYSSRNNTLIGNNANSNSGNGSGAGIYGNGYGYGYGISLQDSSNNTLIGNNLKSNFGYGFGYGYGYDEDYGYGYGYGNGISLQDSSNNTLIGNNLKSNFGYGFGYGSEDSSYGYGYGNGISLYSSSSNTLIGNNANSSSGEGSGDGIYGYGYGYGNGISLIDSKNNTISGNNANSNSGNGSGSGEGYGYGHGITLESSSTNTLSINNANSNSLGIFLNSSNFNKITSNNISNNTEGGIRVYNTSKNNIIDGNKVTNSSSGIFFVYAFNTTASNNIMENNLFNFGVGGNLRSHFEGNNIDTTNLANGRPIYYVKYGKNTIYDSSTKASTFYCILCDNVTVKDMEMSNMDRGIYFWETSNSLIQNLKVLESGWGVYLRLSPNNTIRDSRFSTNNIRDYYETGVSVISSDNNTFENNNFISNNYGLEIYSSSKNTIYNNNFNNTNNVVFTGTAYVNTWNITKKPGKNIIGGTYLGGNFWANPSGKGFSQNCLDSDTDGLCDSKYSLNDNNFDYLPLKYKSAPGITVVSPNGGENWIRGTTQMITWTSTGSPKSYVKIELLKPGLANKLIITSTLNDGSHPWLIPVTLVPGTDYKIKITNTTNVANTDTSDENFIIPTPTITVVTPDGGENWRRGTTQTIKWNSSGSPGTYVKIELLKPGVANKVIISTTLNDGSHPWLIPAAQLPGDDYKVKITSTTNVAYTDTSDNSFTIPTPKITVLSPNGTESWTRGTTQTIKWNSSGSTGTYVKIELLKAGILNRVIVASTLNDGSHPWPILATQAPGTDYKVKITSTSNASYNDTSDDYFTIPVPSFTVVYPDGSKFWTRGTTQTIRWNSTENPKSYVKIELLKSGVAKVIIASTLNDGSHPWLIPATQTPGNDYKVKITSTINVSNNDTSDNDFTIPAPSFTVVSPNGSENWTRGTTQAIKWNSTENPKSYVKIELLKPGVANKVLITSTLNDGTHLWPILSTQTLGSDYRIKITSTINASVNDTSDSNFSIVPPKITVTSPNGGQTWIRGKAYPITWNYTGNPGTYVRIELLKNGLFNRTILASTPNDKSQSWTIPATQTPGTDYRIRVTSTTNVAYNDTSDGNFNISATIP